MGANLRIKNALHFADCSWCGHWALNRLTQSCEKNRHIFGSAAAPSITHPQESNKILCVNNVIKA